MVDGVHGDLDHVVRHVVVEKESILECVMILILHVEGKIVKVLTLILIMMYATPFAVQVRHYCYCNS